MFDSLFYICVKNNYSSYIGSLTVFGDLQSLQTLFSQISQFSGKHKEQTSLILRLLSDLIN